jgi:ubiquinone/menaquinone biosynthesis C-methylase UbiE
MADRDDVFTGRIPWIYDSYLVPLIFESYAKDLAERTAALIPKSILETAAGTGAVTRTLTPMLRPDAHFVVTDLNQPMLDRAAAMQTPDTRISWQQADALHLPFGDRSFDTVLCQFGVMFFPDKIAGYAEAKRVLKPDGTFIFNVWDRIEANDFAYIVTQAAALVFPEDPPRFLARTPHGYHDAEVIMNEVRSSGFSRVSISTMEKTSTAPTPRHAAIAFCQGTPLRNEIEARDAGLLTTVIERATLAISQRHGSGPISGKIRAHVISASPCG